MPSVTYNGQSFAIDGRRIWILGASIEYSRVPAALWSARIEAAKQAGFNTIETACPWSIHEPRAGRFVFQGDADVKKFVQACAAAGMRVILRPGPYIGSQFDGGGLPGWLSEISGIKLREQNEVFLEHVSRYFRKLLGEVSDLQATNGGSGGGPILLVQSEHAWTCSNHLQAEKYLHEVTRFIRESGITVPIINANDLWQESPGTIDTWRGYDDLMVHLRQLRTVQPDAPRLVSAFDPAICDVWGDDHREAASGDDKSPDAVLRRLAEILASGAQPVVSPFHGGTNFGFLGGRLAGGSDKFGTTSAATDAPLGEAGTRGRKYNAIRRLTTFVNHFGQVFAELDSEYQPVVLDPAHVVDHSTSKPNAQSSKPIAALASDPVSVIPLRGPQGQIVFVFSGKPSAATTLVLEDGIRLPINLGDQTVGWFALNVDLQGSGRLDYASVCPWAVIDRSIVVFHGPAKAAVYLSVNNTPFEAVVPAEGAGSKPLVMEHKGLTLVICNQSQIDATYHDDAAVYVGINGFDASGAPIANADYSKAWVIRRDAKIENLEFKSSAEGKKGSRKTGSHDTGPIKLDPWDASPCTQHVNGSSPRFASLEGPQTLSQCGSPIGYGWYRLELTASGKRLCHLPESADRLHLFMEGKRRHLIGVGPGAQPGPFEIKFGKGEQFFVALVDNFGRFSEGNDLAMAKGLWGHLYEVRPMRSAKPKSVNAEPVDPFDLRGFISGRGEGQMSDSRQAVWTFAHTKKNPIVIDVNGAECSGTFVLNDELIAYYAGITGACMDRIMLDPKKTDAFKRGKNVLRFAPDARQEKAIEDISKSTTLYECVQSLTESAGWAFAKWEPPAVATYSTVEKGAYKSFKGVPCWWRTTFDTPEGLGDGDANADVPLWLDVSSLSKGQAFINGQNLGRFFTSTADNRPVGPQTRLYVPSPWLRHDDHINELVIFDEHGFEPSRAKVIRGGE